MCLRCVFVLSFVFWHIFDPLLLLPHLCCIPNSSVEESKNKITFKTKKNQKKIMEEKGRTYMHMYAQT